MLTKNFSRLATENIGNSFVFGFGTRLLSRVLKSTPKGYSLSLPDVYDLRSCLRTGGEFAKHALLYSCNVIALSRIGLPSFLLHISATFLTGFLLAMKNGVSYASRTAAISSITSFFRAIIMRK